MRAAATFLFTAVSLTAQINGRVTDVTGKPLQGVAVISPLLFQATTDAAGEFVLHPQTSPDWKPSLLIFSAPGFRPLIRPLFGGDQFVNAILLPANENEWHVPECSASQQGKRVGGWMSLAVQTGVDVRDSLGGDARISQAVYRSEGKSFSLRIWEGPSCCSGRPSGDEDITAATTTIRTWSAPRIDGLDFRGKKSDGTFWRYVGPRGGSAIEYSGATESAARVFDAMIDSMCVAAR
jgi:hypothetical protein